MRIGTPATPSSNPDRPMYRPPDPEAWQGRHDPEDGQLGRRMHHAVRYLDLSDKQLLKATGKAIAMLGFAVDEGVRRNKGRAGAAQGPQAIWAQWANFASHEQAECQLWDAGIIYCRNQELEKAQQLLANKVQVLLQHQYRPLILGGGHETAYGHFLGLHQSLPAQEKITILNVDAHFDLRKDHQGATSGTPFYQAHQLAAEQNRPLHYHCIGILPQANTTALYEAARQFGVTWQEIGQIDQYGINQAKIRELIADTDHLYLTIDLDGIASAFAPGVSAVNPLGLLPRQVMAIIDLVAASGKMVAMDIVELNPSYDRDQLTAKLAASFGYRACLSWT